MKKILLACCLLAGACKTSQVSTTSQPQDATITVNGKLFTAVFMQKAAEYRALCFQAYNIARLRLDQYKPVSGKPLAIVTDIDETVLDNSSYEVSRAMQGKAYDQASWYEWTSKAMADTVPGAASFLKYAASKGVTVFYITNRDEKERAGTLKNLKKFNFPNADDAHFIPRQNTSSKESRRQAVYATHDIVMMLGDNLADFSVLFDKKKPEERLLYTNFSVPDFGNRFIILPNPVYGDWESSLYNYNYKLTGAQKDSVIRSVLK